MRFLNMPIFFYQYHEREMTSDWVETRAEGLKFNPKQIAWIRPCSRNKKYTEFGLNGSVYHVKIELDEVEAYLETL